MFFFGSITKLIRSAPAEALLETIRPFIRFFCDSEILKFLSTITGEDCFPPELPPPERKLRSRTVREGTETASVFSLILTRASPAASRFG